MYEWLDGFGRQVATNGWLALACIVAAVMLAAGVVWLLTWSAGRILAALRGFPGQAEREQGRTDRLAVVVALMAGAVSAQGMWVVFGEVLGLDMPLRLLFVLFEVGAFAEARRADKHTRMYGKAGVDGAIMWAITAMSGLLSSLDSKSGIEALLRLITPLFAALMWERAMSGSRKDWLEAQKADLVRFPEPVREPFWARVRDRFLVALRLADPEGRTVSEATADRYLDLAAKRIARVRRMREKARSARRSWRRWKAQRALTAATVHAGLGTDPVRFQALRGKLAAHGALDYLVDMEVPPLDALTEPDQGASGAGSQTSGNRGQNAFANRRRTGSRNRSGNGSKRMKAITFDYLPDDPAEAAQLIDERYLAETGKPVTVEELRDHLGIRKTTAGELLRRARGVSKINSSG
ncbi:hypothetical protein [Microbispora sp. NBRC 16548]|uniref:hypothetical protein n=1 Tax=Microbispora sp. NBRC 16548 TaxID=3030994 RepID=UPI00255734F7|nr:hypothetical protein [Microbispora sp. NBRC 16548]